MGDWQIEEGLAVPGVPPPIASEAERGASGNIAVFLKPLVVQNTRKWFGEAELRLDVLVVHGGGSDVGDLYHPRTLRFPRVKDGEDLATGDNGLLVYVGRPAHFIAMSFMLARDTADSDDLAALIQSQASSGALKDSLSALAKVLPAVPQLDALQAGVGAALALGDVAYKLLRQVSPTCLGLYRAAWLEGRHRFGLGRHPSAGAEPVKDFTFAYEIVIDRRPRGASPK